MQAIAESTNWLPHLIWMDIRMPIINGYEAAKKNSRGSDRYTPENYCHDCQPPERRKFNFSVFDDFAGKPFTQKTIFSKMFDHLGITYEGNLD